MTLEQFINFERDAVRSIYVMRNRPTFTDADRQRRVQRQRRDTIRKHIACLRLAHNPATAAKVAEVVYWAIA